MGLRAITVRVLAGAVLAAGLAGATPSLAGSATPGESSDNGSVWWSELITPDSERARHFYATVLGWTPRAVAADDPTRAAEPGEPSYTIMMAQGHDTAGVMRIDGAETGGLKPGWLTYIQVANVDLVAQSAVQNGGRIIREAFDVPGVARIAIVEDPLGSQFGIVKPVE